MRRNLPVIRLHVTMRCLQQRAFPHTMAVTQKEKRPSRMLSENIKAIRKSKGLSQEELAVKLNIVRQTISKWEQGLSVPDSDLLIALSEALETPVSTLLGENVAASKADDLKAISGKLEIINLQLAQRKTTRQKRLHWLFLSLCAVIMIISAVLISITVLTWAGITAILKQPFSARLFTYLNGCLFGWRRLPLLGRSLGFSRHKTTYRTVLLLRLARTSNRPFAGLFYFV